MPYNYKTELQRYRRYYQSLEPLFRISKNQNYTAIIFSFLAISLFGWYAIRPTIQTILTLKKEITDKTDISKKMEDKISALIEAQAAYSEVEPFLPVIEQALPSQPDALPLVLQFRNLANLTGVSIFSIQVPSVPLLGQVASASALRAKIAGQNTKQQVFDISLSVTGDYASLSTFLTGLIEIRRIVSIESTSIVPYRTSDVVASDSATRNTQQLQLALKLKAYYLTP